ncbi:MAG: ATP-binding protein [Cyclobacteriaceae bacterium]|nr:ATP-binding protein [Cyclobacteriaceae bacterium]
MQLPKLRELVSMGEGQLVEFKRKAAFPEKIVREIIAFANSQGGSLIVGVDDDGSIPGVKHVDEEKFILDKAIADYCRPPIKFRHHILRLSEKRSVLVYEIFESKRKPHYLLPKPNARYGRAYVRINDKSVKASNEWVYIFKLAHKNKGFTLMYGDHERVLMQYLGSNGYITLNKYIEISGLTRPEASRVITSMVLGGVLILEAGEKEDRYFTKPVEQSKPY